jgi:hypothetical protein
MTIYFSTEGVTNGDPHYRTFDGRHYNFQGKCEYIFAKDCSEDHAFEVLQQNEACARPGSCTKSLKIITQQMEIRMERGGIVYVDGIRVPLPWRASTPTTPSNLEVSQAKRQTTGNLNQKFELLAILFSPNSFYNNVDCI